jgi:hypothetical protein
VTWTPGKAPLITLRDGSVLDWAATVREFRNSEVIEEIASTQEAINARFQIVTQLGGQRIDGGQPAGSFTAPPAGPPAQGDGRSCQHGTMNFNAGTGKNGKPYKRYDCPSKVQGCGPQWG